MTASGLRFPDFLCIGAQKAGTTWLDANLRRHPGIWMPWIKELQYFNDVHIPAHRAWTRRHRQFHGGRAAERERRRAGEVGPDPRVMARIESIIADPVSDEWYGAIFAHAAPGQICGEVTPEYSLLPPEGIAHVKRLNPKMKIIFLMRDPVERCWSHLRMLARGRPDFDFLSAASAPDVLLRADYARIVRDWQLIFGEDAVFVEWVEVATKHSQEFLKKIMRFLDIDWHDRVSTFAERPVFVGPELKMPDEIRIKIEKNLSNCVKIIPSF